MIMYEMVYTFLQCSDALESHSKTMYIYLINTLWWHSEVPVEIIMVVMITHPDKGKIDENF